MEKKSFIFLGISIAVFVASLICNIVFICAPVYHGTYSYNDGTTTTSFTFYENTFTYESKGNSYTYDYGFYSIIPKGTTNGYITATQDNTIAFTSIGNTFNRTAIRVSVFKIQIATIGSDWNTQKDFICTEAIIIQIIFCVILVGSFGTAAMYIKQWYNSKHNNFKQ